VRRRRSSTDAVRTLFGALEGPAAVLVRAKTRAPRGAIRRRRGCDRGRASQRRPRRPPSQGLSVARARTWSAPARPRLRPRRAAATSVAPVLWAFGWLGGGPSPRPSRARPSAPLQHRSSRDYGRDAQVPLGHVRPWGLW
jgi:hypothetical protein